VTAILTADMEGFSSWMQRDEQAVIELLIDTYYEYAKQMVERFDGELFQKEGDAIWCTFARPDDAISGGLWILGQFHQYNRARSAAEKVRLRVGVSWGGREHHALQEAKKLESSATPGAVHFSQAIFERLERPRGLATDRFSNKTFELFSTGQGSPIEGHDEFVLVARVIHLSAAARRSWTRRAFQGCHESEGDFFLGHPGLVVVSGATGTWLKNLKRDVPYLQSIFFSGVTTDQACQLATEMWQEPNSAPLILGSQTSPLRSESQPTSYLTSLERGPDTPYKFLSAYRASDSLIFFGREAETDRLQALLSKHPFLVLYGKSGVGKTSLLQAGLQGLVDGHAPQFLSMRLRSDPVAQVLRTLRRSLSESSEAASARELWQQLLSQASRGAVLIIDQFEQLFLRATEALRKEFLELLEDLNSVSGERGHIVVSVREDFLAEVFALDRYWDRFSLNRMRLKSLDRDSTLDSIIQPAELFGVRVDKVLAERVVDSLSQEGVHPAELQIVMDMLYRHRKVPERISLEDYQASGGVDRILRAYLDEALQSLPAKDRERARVLLKALVSEKGTRQAVSYRELVDESGLATTVLDVLLRTLLDSRLIRVVGDHESLSYELAHETLVSRVREWETPLEVARRHAQLILRNEFRNYRRVGGLLPRDRLALLAKPEIPLQPTNEERLMLVRASVIHQFDPAFWMKTEEHQKLCSSVVLEMLQDPALEAALRRQLIGTVARLPLEDRALQTLFECAQQLANPGVLAALRDVPSGVLEGLREAVRERFFGEGRTALVPEGECWVGSSLACKQARRAVTRPDLHSRIESERDFQRITLPPYRIDRTAVTNQEYAEFEPLHSHFFPPEEADYPAVNVSFQEASLYARWLGKRLPTEEEWEKAARGTQGQTFPWGDEFDSSLVNSGESERRAPLRVDGLPAGDSPYGCRQMSGNVWEWTSTPWEPDSPLMAKKGGCALNFAPLMHCSARYEDPPEMRLRWAGFRLVGDG
jgi:class 3 adenylate cyclase/AAA+ ATPase superfamily predicted ATPase